MSTDERTDQFGFLLEYLRRSRGFDFTGYKPASLMRRIQRRLQTLDMSDYVEYIDYLEVHPEEFNYLFNTILINVTSFFRDPAAWQHLISDVIPRLLAAKAPTHPVRVWSAGCASGQEAYALAMALAEVMGIDQYRDRVKIYATDVDEEALVQARSASYSSKEIASIPPNLVERYFEPVDSRYVFRKDLRRTIIFGRNDLLQDAPISRIDLLVCRNTMIYFTAETQARILTRFHFALNENGFLFLGRAEMLLTHTNLFTPVDLRWRIFSRLPRSVLRDHFSAVGRTENAEKGNFEISHVRLRDVAFDTGPVAEVIIDSAGIVCAANERARSLFDLSQKDLSRPLQDLELSYRPLELRSCIDQAYNQRRLIHVRDVEWKSSSETRWLEVQIAPLMDSGGFLLGVSVSFSDSTHYKRLQDDLEISTRELEAAYEELQSTNEELETTNEELQSTVEELETTNEELQCTNEEMETMNEELQSTNEDLQTINEELRQRTGELDHANAFLEAVLVSLRGGVVVLDPDLHIQVWNHHSEELWGLRPEEVRGKHFMNLDIGLPVEQLRQPIRECLAGELRTRTFILPATNRRGRAIQCLITCTALAASDSNPQGVILLMQDHGSSGEAGRNGSSGEAVQNGSSGETVQNGSSGETVHEGAA